MQHHYPSVVGRFALVDLGLGTLFIGTLLFLGHRARTSEASHSGVSKTSENPWMVIYAAEDGATFPGLDRYESKQAAALAAGQIGHVVVSGERRPVHSYVVGLDPERDRDRKKRQRRRAADGDKSHAYCMRCERRIYAGEKSCECGNRLSPNWEQLFEEKIGAKPEAFPPGPRSSPLLPQPTLVRASTDVRRAVADQHADDDRQLALDGAAVEPEPPTKDPELAQGTELVAQLRELANLHSAGALSEAEFEQAKARLISH
jgi:hypothetical protein